MIHRCLFFIAICVVYLGLASAAFAGAWTQNRGGYYFKVGASYLNSTIDIDANGKQIQKANMGELRDLNYSTYLEYGLLDRLTLVSSVPYKRLQDTRTLTRSQFGCYGNGTGAPVGIWRHGDAFALAFRPTSPWLHRLPQGGKIPLWYEEDPNTRVPLSSKKVDADVRILLGQSLVSSLRFM